MAKSFEDQEPRITDLIKLFFAELFKKDNAIYNNLSDGALPSPLFVYFLFSMSVFVLPAPAPWRSVFLINGGS